VEGPTGAEAFDKLKALGCQSPIALGEGHIMRLLGPGNRFWKSSGLRVGRRQRSEDWRVLAPGELLHASSQLDRLGPISHRRVWTGRQQPSQAVAGRREIRADFQGLLVMSNGLSPTRRVGLAPTFKPASLAQPSLISVEQVFTFRVI
jgi:hypothetical protein